MTISITAENNLRSAISVLAIELAARLIAEGHDVHWRPIGGSPDGIPVSLKERTVTHVKGRELVITPLMFGTLPCADDSVCLSMWETNRVPRWNVQVLNRYSEVWTPTEWNAKVLRHSGVTVPIRVVPLGIDHRVFNLNGRKMPSADPSPKEMLDSLYDPPPRPLTFGTVAHLQPSADRKNIGALVSSFQKAFHGYPDVRLKLKLQPGDPPYQTDDKRVESLCETLPTHRMVEWFQNLDAYVCPSRGEGWCLPALEAMACGAPVITSPCGGIMAFVNHRNGYIVHGDLVPSGIEGAGSWWSIDQRELSEAMLRVYWDRVELEQKAKMSAQESQLWTLDGTVENVVRLLKV